MSLDYIAENDSVITSAVSTQDWPGEAAVDVSIVNWTQRPRVQPSECVLDGREVSGVASSLTTEADPAIQGADRLLAPKKYFQGNRAVGRVSYSPTTKPLSRRCSIQKPQSRPAHT